MISFKYENNGLNDTQLNELNEFLNANIKSITDFFEFNKNLIITIKIFDSKKSLDNYVINNLSFKLNDYVVGLINSGNDTILCCSYNDYDNTAHKNESFIDYKKMILHECVHILHIYYMAKDKIPIRKSLIVIILGTIYFKLFMVIFAIIVLLFKWDFIINQGTLFIVLFFLGVVIDSLLIIGCYLLLFHSQAIKKLLTFVYKIKTKLTGKNDENKVNELIENYRKETDYINNHKKEVFVSLILTFFQRIFLFSIAFVIYKAFGFNEYSYIDLLVIQIGVQLAIEGLPLPGGTGVSEHLFNTIFISIFGASLASTGMFLTRLFSFYLPLLVSCVIIIIVTKCCYYKNK